MLTLNDIKVGQRYKLLDLDNIYDVVIILGDIIGDSYKTKTGIIKYLGKPNTDEVVRICEQNLNRCVIYKLSSDLEYDFDE
jgi:hypothetical protein